MQLRFSQAFSMVIQSRSGLVDEAPAGKRHVDAHIAQIFRWNAFQIIGKDYKVRETAGSDFAPVMFAAAAQCGVGGIRPERFEGTYALVWAKENASAAHSVDSRMHSGQGCDR